MRAGQSRDDAVRAARVERGSLEAAKDHTRDAGWEIGIENTWRDVRYAARTLRKSPAFSAVAVLTLSLGIGANTAIFSVLNAVMLRPLPVERPEELLSLAAGVGDNRDPVFSYAAYRQFADEGVQVIDAIAASATNRAAVIIDDAPEPVSHKWVSGNYFTVLGARAAAGRTLLPSDDRLPAGERVAVISDAYWTRRFGRDPSVLGRTLRIQATPFTVVGIAQRGFFGESAGEAPDLWLPLTARPAPAWVWSGHGTTWLGILARRKDGVTIAQARAGLDRVYGRIREDMAAIERPERRDAARASRLVVSPATGGSPRLRDNLARPLQLLMGIVGLVLVIACANVANLMLARAARRRRETAVCLAIGAGRARLVRQRLVEALLLASLGGAAGLLLAAWGAPSLVALVARVAPVPIVLDVGPDARVLAFTMLVSCATALLFGLVPALGAARVDLLPALKVNVPGGGTARFRLGRSLVVTQIALSLMLLVVAGLFVRTLQKLQEVDSGFDADRVLLFELMPPADDQPIAPEEQRNLYRALLARAEGVPGVGAASASFVTVFTNNTGARRGARRAAGRAAV